MYLNIIHLPGGTTRVIPAAQETPFAVITRSRRFPEWSLVGTFADMDAARAYVARQDTARARRNGSEWTFTPADPVRVSRADMDRIGRASA